MVAVFGTCNLIAQDKDAIADAVASVTQEAVQAPAFPMTVADLADVKERTDLLHDDCYRFYTADDGTLFLVYDWEKPATVYSLTLSKGTSYHDWSEVMTIVPDGRTKGKLKISQAMKCLEVRPGLESSSTLNKGEVIASFSPFLVSSDFLETEVTMV